MLLVPLDRLFQLFSIQLAIERRAMCSASLRLSTLTQGMPLDACCGDESCQLDDTYLVTDVRFAANFRYDDTCPSARHPIEARHYSNVEEKFRR